MRLLCCFLLFWLTSTSFAQQFFPIKVNQKWGLIDKTGKVVVRPTYDAIGDFYQFGYAVVQKEGKVGVMNESGALIVPVNYYDLQILDSTIFAVVIDNSWQIINLQGKIILKDDYEKVNIWNSEYISFSKKGKWGLVHLSGKSIAPPVYDHISIYKNIYFKTEANEKYGLIRNNGQILISPSADAIIVQSDSLFFYKKDYKWGAVNQQGKALLQSEWDGFQMIGKSFIQLLHDKNTYLYAIHTNKIIAKKKYNGFIPFSKDKVLFKKRQHLGVLSDDGKELLSGIYDEIQPYGVSQYRVRKKKRWGVIDSDEKTIIPFEFDYISPLQKEVCVVRKGALFGIANFKGELIIPAEYDKIELKNNVARAFVGSNLTLLTFDSEGKLLGKSNIGKHASIKIKKRTPTINVSTQGSDEGDELNYILERFEWFYSPQDDLWGLRSLETGDIQIKPTFENVEVKKELGFTLVYKKRFHKQKINQTNFQFEYVYGLVNNEKGLLVTDLNILDIRLSDFEEKNLDVARCILNDGKHGLIQKTGKIIKKDYAYIGEFINGLARASARGRLSGETKNINHHLGKVTCYLEEIRSSNQMIDFTNYDKDFIENAYLTCDECDWGFIDTAGEVKIPEIYSFTYDFVNGIAIAEKEGKWGFINEKNQTLLEFKYDGIQFLSNTNQQMLRLYINENKYGLIDTMGRAVISVNYEDVGEAREGLIPVQKNGMWGFATPDGELVIPCQYERANAFHSGLAAVRKGRKWGFINRFNSVIIPFEYKDVGNFKNDKAWFKLKYKYGYINSKGEVVISAQFEDAKDFDGNVARVRSGDDWGLINHSGVEVLKAKYVFISNFDKVGFAVIQFRSGDYSFINKNGNRITNRRFQKVLDFNEGLAAVKKGDLWGFIDTTGEMVISPKFRRVLSFQDGRASVKSDNQWGFIDRKGKWVIEPQFSKCLSYKNGKAVVYKGYRNAGLIDLNGNFIIEPSISRMLDFNDGRGLVRDGNYRFYYINEDNRLYKGYYQNAESFRDGVVAVQKRGKWGLINDNGIELIPPKYDKVEAFSDGFAKVRITQFSGIASRTGKIIAEPKYEYISYAGNGVFRVEEGDKVGYFDSKGKWIWKLNR